MNLINIFDSDQKTREVFEKDRLIASDVHPTLAKSWIRSVENKVDPNISSAPTSVNFYLNDIEQLIVDTAKPHIKYFSSILVNSEAILAISNAEGIIIHIIHAVKSKHTNKINKLVDRHNLLIGANWSEKYVGTNGIGTVLEEQTSLMVLGSGFYSYSFAPYAAAGAPIFNCGKIIGTVCIVSFKKYVNSYSLGLAVAIAKINEKELKIRMEKFQTNNKSLVNINKCFSIPIIKMESNNKSSLEIVGNNSLFNLALTDAGKVAKTPLNVFLSGETGTGKELFARYIHDNSKRSQGPFIAVNCAAIPKDLVASELFGYIGGAFTGANRQGRLGHFEQASGGTLFLDEIADAPYEVQVGLLRVLDEKKLYRLGSERGTPIDVRILSATSQDLRTLIKEKLFREDLYYRLAGLIIDIPPLRHRDQDIILLAEYFLNNYRSSFGRQFILDNDLKQLLLKYDWPGNIRELKNLIDRMAVLSEDELLSKELFIKYLQRNNESNSNIVKNDNPIIFRDNFYTINHKEVLTNAIKQADGNISQVAKLLGVNRTTVYRRMKKQGLII